MLKPGSRACFAIWGREEYCLIWSIWKQTFANLGKPTAAVADYDRFWALSGDQPALKQMFVEAGFSDVRMWHQAGNWFLKDGAHFWENIRHVIGPENGRDEAIQAEMTRLFDETKHEMRTFEKLFILVSKD